MVFELCSPEKCRGEGMRSDLTKLAVADLNKQCKLLILFWKSMFNDTGDI